MMAPACNSSYMEDRDKEDPSVRSVWAKSYWESISTNKQGVVAHLCVGGMGKEDSSLKSALGKKLWL
jgi:hypothetical protein